MLRPLISLLLGFTLLLGVAVPLGFTALASLTMTMWTSPSVSPNSWPGCGRRPAVRC